MTYQVVCQETDLEPGEVEQVTINGMDLAIARDSDGSWHALSDLCTHGNVSLSDGDVEDGGIECWKHGSIFDLRTGKPRQLPAIHPVTVYALKLESGNVLVDTNSPLN
ncbi:non-heme iron oxygenase ferredoxin subunit [Flaviflexus massiliensis]|uniref:non-heme iron oxygenase ferredoxin subunit n=1 Tax=Flaviflexus massiliensis TaxID=1522309 RepID=UPI0006D575DC|nr:non-heme iron oxygenase ferredoxin subunit [Flaviflexus massiliensis]